MCLATQQAAAVTWTLQRQSEFQQHAAVQCPQEPSQNHQRPSVHNTQAGQVVCQLCCHLNLLPTQIQLMSLTHRRSINIYNKAQINLR